MPISQLQVDQPLDKENYLDFDFAKTRLKVLIDDWSAITEDSERNRTIRYIKTDIDSLKAAGLFKEDETFVGCRLIDQNIRAEIPSFVSYITQPRRSAIFSSSIGQPVQGIENIEKFFTDVARYEGWEIPFLKVVDGSLTHGWDFVEIVFDISRPGHFSIEHVGRDQLLFDKETEDFQNQEIIIRVEKKSGIQLKQSTKLLDRKSVE